MDEELKRLRERIDEIDKRIVALLEERVDAAKKIGEIKKKKKIPLSDPKREKTVVENASKTGRQLDKGFIESLFGLIIDYCKNEERR